MLVSIFSLIAWVLGHIWDISSKDVIPQPLAWAWIIACFGRVATFILYWRPPLFLQIAFYAVTFGVVVMIWTLAEAMLKGCGATAGVLPSYESLGAAIIGLPLAEIFVAVVSALF